MASPTVGELTAMTIFNGSDAGLAAGFSLLRQLLPHVSVHVAALAEGADEPVEIADSRVDRNLVESILLNMDEAACR